MQTGGFFFYLSCYPLTQKSNAMEQSSNLFDLQIDQSSINYLSETARWSRFLATHPEYSPVPGLVAGLGAPVGDIWDGEVLGETLRVPEVGDLVGGLPGGHGERPCATDDGDDDE